MTRSHECLVTEIDMEQRSLVISKKPEKINNCFFVTQWQCLRPERRRNRHVGVSGSALRCDCTICKIYQAKDKASIPRTSFKQQLPLWDGYKEREAAPRVRLYVVCPLTTTGFYIYSG